MITFKLSNDKADAYGINSVADLETKLSASIELENKLKTLESQLSDLQKSQTAGASVVTPAADAGSIPTDETKAAEQANEVAPAAEDKPEETAVAAPAAETVADETKTLKQELAELKAQQGSAIAKAVADAFSSLGSPIPLSVDNSITVTSKSREELLQEMNAITNPVDRSAFYDKHRSAFLGK